MFAGLSTFCSKSLLSLAVLERLNYHPRTGFVGDRIFFLNGSGVDVIDECEVTVDHDNSSVVLPVLVVKEIVGIGVKYAELACEVSIPP